MTPAKRRKMVMPVHAARLGSFEFLSFDIFPVLQCVTLEFGSEEEKKDREIRGQ